MPTDSHSLARGHLYKTSHWNISVLREATIHQYPRPASDSPCCGREGRALGGLLENGEADKKEEGQHETVGSPGGSSDGHNVGEGCWP